jgi:hypothetical protein
MHRPFAGRRDLQRRGLVDAHSDQFGMLEDQAQQPVVPPPADEVLIDDRVRQKPEARGRDDVVTLQGDPRLALDRPVAAGPTLVAGDHDGRHDRRARGGAAQHGAVAVERVQRGLDGGILEVGRVAVLVAA